MVVIGISDNQETFNSTTRCQVTWPGWDMRDLQFNSATSFTGLALLSLKRLIKLPIPPSSKSRGWQEPTTDSSCTAEQHHGSKPDPQGGSPIRRNPTLGQRQEHKRNRGKKKHTENCPPTPQGSQQPGPAPPPVPAAQLRPAPFPVPSGSAADTAPQPGTGSLLLGGGDRCLPRGGPGGRKWSQHRSWSGAARPAAGAEEPPRSALLRRATWQPLPAGTSRYPPPHTSPRPSLTFLTLRAV